MQEFRSANSCPPERVRFPGSFCLVTPWSLRALRSSVSGLCRMRKKNPSFNLKVQTQGSCILFLQMQRGLGNGPGCVMTGWAAPSQGQLPFMEKGFPEPVISATWSSGLFIFSVFSTKTSTYSLLRYLLTWVCLSSTLGAWLPRGASLRCFRALTSTPNSSTFVSQSEFRKRISLICWPFFTHDRATSADTGHSVELVFNMTGV